MTTISMALKRLLDKAGSEEFLRSALENILQFLMDTDVPGRSRRLGMSGHLPGAISRNGYRERWLASGVGESQGIFLNCGVVRTARNFWSHARRTHPC